jgi:acyl-CoA synthetase (AMP-forming)/AMP-acid ligase II
MTSRSSERTGALPPLDTPEYPRIGDYVTHWAAHTPDAEALVLNQSRISYAELAKLVDRCAAKLVDLGVRPGDRVAMLSTPRPEFLIVFLAAARVGAVWVGLNPKYTLDELRYVVDDAQPVVLIVPAAVDGRAYRDDAETLASEVAAIRHVVVLELGPQFTPEPLSTLLIPEGILKPAAKWHEEVTAHHAALLVYTSGTTGKPKGALLPHRGLVHCSRIQRAHLRAQPLRMLNNLPVNHVGCVGDICAFVLVSGGTVVFAERFEPGQVGPLIRDERITLWGQVPTMFQLTLDDPGFDPHMVGSVQEIAWSGAMAPEYLVRRLRDLCPELRSFYGMTETVGSVCYSHPDASLDDLARTIGRPDPRYDVRIADPEGNVPPRGEAAEIQVRGDFLMLGYLNQPEATRNTFTADGWLRTGDLAIEEPDGQYRLIGRLREMFKSGGYNVYPKEIEAVLESHPAVNLAAVVAVPDPLYGDVGAAFLLCEAGASVDDALLQGYCREHLANYKIPKRFHVLDAMPMLPIGKVDRAELKRRARSQGTFAAPH